MRVADAGQSPREAARCSMRVADVVGVVEKQLDVRWE